MSVTETSSTEFEVQQLEKPAALGRGSAANHRRLAAGSARHRAALARGPERGARAFQQKLPV